MPDNTVTVERSGDVSTLDFSSIFNAAVPFVDRHIDEGRADKTVIRTTSGEAVTYASLAENVNRCGNALSGLGVASGERVLMIVKDCPAFFYVFWGAIKTGIIPVPLNTLLRAKDYQYMIEDSGAAAVIYSPEFATEVEPAVAAAKHRPARIFTTEGQGIDSLDARINSANSMLAPALTAPDDDCFWLYSSGSTGTPKGTVHAHRSMVLTSQLYGVDTLGFGEDDTSFSAAKLFFAYGLGNAMTFPLWVGGGCVLEAGRPTPDGIFDAIERFRPSHFFGVPTLYAALLAIEAKNRDVGSLKTCVSAGEALPPDILRRWQEATGLSIYEGIGTTEALHIFISSSPGALKPGYTGKMVPGYLARLLDEEGNELGADAPGNLEIYAPSAAKYYWNKPEKTEATMLGDNWLSTGDVFSHNEEDFYQCSGRSDDMLKVGGIWCSPYEIEAKLVEHTKVLEAAVVGREDENELIKPEAFVILNDAGDAGEAAEQELREHCKGGLAPYKYPRWINFVDELPKTATGKIQRFKLRT